MTKAISRVAVIAVGTLVLVGVAGCESTPLLSGKKAPDETSVVEAPPLFLPPDFQLRPPGTATRPMASPSGQIQAEQLLTGQTPAAPAVATPAVEGDAADWLLNPAGGADRDPSIRTQIDVVADQDQAVAEEKAEKGWFGRLLDFGDKEPDQATIKTDAAGRVILDADAPDAEAYKTPAAK